VNRMIALSLAEDFDTSVASEPRQDDTPSAVRTAEARLIHALLEQAAEDLAVHRDARDPIGARLYRDAWRWVVSADRFHPFSFVNVCELLQYSPEAVRRRLLRRHGAPASAGDARWPILRRA